MIWVPVVLFVFGVAGNLFALLLSDEARRKAHARRRMLPRWGVALSAAIGMFCIYAILNG